MTDLCQGLALFLLLNILAGLARIARGPTPVDRMMAAQLFGTTGVAILLLLAQGMGAPALREVALVFALLAAVAAVAFSHGTEVAGPEFRVPGEALPDTRNPAGERRDP